MASLTRGTTFVTGVANDVTADKLHALVDAATPTSGFIQDRTSETVIASNDTLLFGDASASDDLKRITVANFRSAATFGTTTSTAATITSGTITTLNSTTGTITTGVIPTLTSTTLITTGTGTAASPAIVPTGDSNTGIFFPAADTIAVSEGGTEAMRIDSSGNVFIGTTSNFSADKMCLNFTSAQNGLGVRDDSNSSGANYAVFRNSTNGITGTIARVTTTNEVVYNTTSDQRLKSNIADALPVLDKLMDVKVRQFDWTEGNLHQDAGFIAQELAPILSGIVTEGKTQEDWWQLDYARLTPYLVKAIQELKVKNDSLEARLQALEAK